MGTEFEAQLLTVYTVASSISIYLPLWPLWKQPPQPWPFLPYAYVLRRTYVCTCLLPENVGFNENLRSLRPIGELDRSFGGHYGRRIGRLVVVKTIITTVLVDNTY